MTRSTSEIPDIEVGTGPLRGRSVAIAIDRRVATRYQTTQHVGLVTRQSRLICDMLDLSETGAKLQIVDGAVPSEGEQLLLVLFDGTVVPAIVRWVGAKSIGVTFVTDLVEVDRHVDSDAIDHEYISKAVRLQKKVMR